MAPTVVRGAAPVPVTDPTWADDWITVRCWACGRQGQWPQPELGCDCGTTLRIPVVARGSVAGESHAEGPVARAEGPVSRAEGPVSRTEGPVAGDLSATEPTGAAGTTGATERGAHGPDDGDPGDGEPHGPTVPSHIPLPRTAPRPRPAFRPVTIRDARDAVTVAALYLRWLGYLNTRSAAGRPTSGTRIAARGLLAQVEPALRPTTLRDVECLWLTAMNDAGDTPVTCAYFSLSGYTPEARACADSLAMPLFTMDLTGTPQPINSAADELVATGA
ncbi:hypothetical protein [Streptomyces sp. NPDC052114]|uniref:hypothetical protein n=1 Tax=unclassified Streptomyces TaxID=2593676 RepID=UPI00342128BB